jgi:hypothetical protein
MNPPPAGEHRAARPPRCSQPPADRHGSLPRKRPRGGPCPSRDDSCELTDEDREWARRTVASLPPLTSRQRDILALLLRQRRS